MIFPIVTLTLATAVFAVPTRRAFAPSDQDILQFALTLEHLEDNFYQTGLKKWNAKAFTDAGFPAFVRGRFEEIAAHEHSHVVLLENALGSIAVKPCNYSFPDKDVASFVTLSSIFEGVGTSAYLGAGGLIQSKQLLTVASSILTTEARQQAWVKSAVLKAQPWSGPEDTPLTMNQAFSLATPFIVGCPSTNAAIPIRALPPLTATPANAASGTTVTYSFANQGNQTYYAAYLHGLDVKTVKLDAKKNAKIPAGLIGTYYTVITTSSAGNVTDANTVAGGLVSIVDFNSQAKDVF